jgi:hypothetical protein
MEYRGVCFKKSLPNKSMALLSIELVFSATKLSGRLFRKIDKNPNCRHRR